MNWKKMIVIGALACGAAGLMTGCGGEKKAEAPAADKSAKPTKIVAGMDDTFAPMGFRDDKGEIVGFDIDMAKAVSKEIAYRLNLNRLIGQAKRLNWNPAVSIAFGTDSP